jgi:hypothetical protein
MGLLELKASATCGGGGDHFSWGLPWLREADRAPSFKLFSGIGQHYSCMHENKVYLIEISNIEQGFQNCGPAPRGAFLVLRRGVSCLYEGYIILNPIWAQDRTYILVSNSLGWSISTHHLIPVPNTQHILSRAKLKNMCNALAELYVRSVYLNLFGWRGREVHETS